MKNTTGYIFKVTDKGYIGKAFEMAIKDALNRRNADKVSPCGTADFRFYHKNYDVKQNGTVIRYNMDDKYIKGSNRVIYAVHVAYDSVKDDKNILVDIDLKNTEMYVLDRNEFISFLLENKLAKVNQERGTVNIQTCYNYTKNAYHGLTGVAIERWAIKHQLQDNIIDEIMNGLN